jgi:hypothetical protein
MPGTYSYRIRGTKDGLVSSDWVAGGNGCEVLPLATPVTLGPSNSVATLTPTYTWASVPGATSYDLYTVISGVASTTSYTASAANCALGGVCAITPITALVGGNSVYWVVRARNVVDTSPYSTSRDFTTMDTTAIPILIGPSISIATLRPTYAWNSVPGATSYDLYTSINGVGSTVSYTASDGNCSLGGVCAITPPAPLVGGDSVYWIVRGKNSAGTSAYSLAKTFKAMDTSSAPTLIGPTKSVATLTPTYTWNSVPGATDYELYTSINSVGSTVSYTADAGNCSLGGVCAITPLAPLVGGDSVYWTVRGKNNAGTSAYGSAKTFQSMDTSSAPTLIGPAGSVATLTPTYIWNSVPGATDYELYTSINSVGSTVSYTAAAGNCSLGGVCAITPAAPLVGGDSVYWTVRGKNNAGTCAYSSAKTFKAMDTSSAPTLIGPTVSVATLTPTYTWNSVPGATDYEIYTSINSVGSTVSYTAAAGNCSLGGVCAITPPAPLVGGDSVYWIVRGKNSAGTSAYGAAKTFKPMDTSSAPTLIGPAGSVATLSPYYTWNSVPGATSYDLRTEINGVPLTVTYSAEMANCSLGGVCAIKPSTSLNNDDSVYWLVRAKNTAGQGDWGSSLTYAVSLAQP